MSNNQVVTTRRLSKQFWRDFGRVVRQARKYSDCHLTAEDVVEELNELVSYYDLEQVVLLGVPEADLPGKAVFFDDSEGGKAAMS